MAWVLGQQAGLDTERLLKLMLLHDLPEAEVGDVTPYGDVLAGEELLESVPRWRELVTPDQLAAARVSKRNLEEAAVERLAAQLPQILGDDLRELWLDYSERRSAEAQFAAQIDKLEAALQALEYRDAGQEADVANFLLSAREVVAHPVLLDLLAEIEAAAED
jgi:5'-deoxynucleotidase YfbR-like HD superfamily hydrolase